MIPLHADSRGLVTAPTPVLASMREERFSKKEICRRTALSYNTVKKYLVRLDDEATYDASEAKPAA